MKLSEKFASENENKLIEKVRVINKLLLDLCEFTVEIGLEKNSELILYYSANKIYENGKSAFPHNQKFLDIEFTNKLGESK